MSISSINKAVAAIALLSVSLLMCVDGVDVTSYCLPVCYGLCKVVGVNCKASVAMTLYHGNCSDFIDSCHDSCANDYCPCVNKIEKQCKKNNSVCKLKDNALDWDRIREVSSCVANRSAVCYGAMMQKNLDDFILNLDPPCPGITDGCLDS